MSFSPVTGLVSYKLSKALCSSSVHLKIKTILFGHTIETPTIIFFFRQDLLSYSQDVDLKLTEYLKDVKPVIEENHMYIRIASNDFFSVSRDVVSRMISGEYDAEQAYESFNTQLLAEGSTSENIVLDSQKSYSNRFHSSGGNAAYSVMANTLRGIYGTDVLIATGNSFTGKQ